MHYRLVFSPKNSVNICPTDCSSNIRTFPRNNRCKQPAMSSAIVGNFPILGDADSQDHSNSLIRARAHIIGEAALKECDVCGRCRSCLGPFLYFHCGCCCSVSAPNRGTAGQLPRTHKCRRYTPCTLKHRAHMNQASALQTHTHGRT